MSQESKWPLLAEDLVVLQEAVETRRKQLSKAAGAYKQGFNTSQTLIILGGVVLVALSAWQAATDPEIPWLSVAEAVLGFLLGVVVLLGRELGLQRTWLDQRMASEAMKHEFYFFLGRVGEYADASDPVALLKQRVWAIEKELAEKELLR